MPTPPSQLHDYALKTLKVRRKQYIETPATIIEHYNSEQENINSYNGRQLLEMLQNADDAAIKQGIQKKALIRLESNELTIANNGYSFSDGGLESILYSNLSPKVMEQNMIGQKGLGFRSVLSWSEEVTILSDKVCIKFSQKIADDFLQEILKGKPAIRRYLATKTKVKSPIAVLRVPAISQATTDLANSFDTCVIIKLKEGVIEKVQEQINKLVDGETLIFLNNLEEVELVSPKRNEKLIKKKTSAGVNIKIVNGLDNPQLLWFINTLKGTHEGKNFELKVAWTKDLLQHSGIIHSYFKTRQLFPFPGLIHGTFELTPDRNDLIDDPEGKNEFLLEKLADLLVDTALKVALLEKKATYKPLQFLNIETDKLNGIFRTYDFPAKLITAIKNAKVFPSVNGHYLNYSNQPVFYQEPVAELIKGADVNNLILHTVDISLKAFLNKIGHYHYTKESYSQIINKRLNSNAEVLSVLIASFLRSTKSDLQKLNGNFSSLKPLFRDENKKPISWDHIIFWPTKFSRERLFLPEEAQLSFLDTGLANELLTFYKIDDYAGLENKLTPFPFKKFTYSTFVEILKNVYLKQPTIENIKLFHQNLFALKKVSQDRGEAFNSQPEYGDLPAINKFGKIVKISALYVGANYGEENLAQELFGKAPEKLLADAKAFGLKRSAALKAYFYWLGVKSKPAKINLTIGRTSNHYTAFKNYFLSWIRYPEKIGNYTFTDRNNLIMSLDSFDVQSFEDLDHILKYASYESILKWVQADGFLRNALESRYDGRSQAGVKFNNNTTPVSFSKMPNFLKWRVANAAWIPGNRGLIAPQICLFSKTIANSLSPLLVQPKLDRSKLARTLQVTSSVLTTYFRLVGINSEVSDLHTHQVYGMLLSLKQKNISGKLAKYLYRELLQNSEDPDYKDENYLNFISNGYIWATKGTSSGYQPVSGCRYVDTKKYSDNIISNFQLAALDRKQGVQKILERLGVKPLNDLVFSISAPPKFHALNDIFRKEMEQYKAIVYAFKFERDKQERILKLLKKLDINIVTRIEGSYTYNGQSVAFEMENYDFIEIQEKNNTRYFIKVPASDTRAEDYRGKLSFGETIAEIFTTISRSDERRSFMRDLYFRRPQDREELFVHEIQTDGYQKLERSKVLLGLVTDRRANFWKSYFCAKNIAITDHALQTNTKLYEKIRAYTSLSEAQINYFLNKAVYDNTTKHTFLQNVYQLLCTQEVDVIHFFERFEELDFEPIFQSEYRFHTDKHQSQFSRMLYDKAMASGVLSTKGVFYNNLQVYSTASYDPRDGFQSDIKEHFFNAVNKRFGIKLSDSSNRNWNLNTLQRQKRSAFDARYPEESQNTALDTMESQSLILLDEWPELIKILQKDKPDSAKPTQSKPIIRLGSQSLDNSSKKALGEAMDSTFDYTQLKIIVASNTVVTDTETKSPHNLSTRTSPMNYNFNKADNVAEDIGFIGEKLVYEALCKIYDTENVKWVSENGKSSGVNPIGIMGLGYDITYMTNGQTRMVEVKCIISTINGFIMTNKEMRVALQNAHLYDLITVEGIHSEQPILTQFCNLFDFEEGQNLFNNIKFSLSNESYKISFIKS